MKQDIREVPSVVDDDVIGLQNLQVAHGAVPFVGMGGDVEIKGQLGLQLIEATEQALRIVGGSGGSRVVASEQLSCQVDLGAVDGNRAMAEPVVVGDIPSGG